MKKDKIDFRTSAYFPSGMIFVGILLLFIGVVVLIAKSPVAGTVIILASAIILTTHYRLAIDFENGQYKDYVWFLGLKRGETERFEKIEYIFIKQSKLSQNMNSLISTRTITKDAFNGYLKFSENETVHLLTKVNKTDLLDRLNKIAAALQVKVVDYSTN
jgi:hypothetical protein